MNDLQQEMRKARHLISCCDFVIVGYEPGCSYAQCSGCKKKAAVPDWDPSGLVEAWKEAEV